MYQNKNKTDKTILVLTELFKLYKTILTLYHMGLQINDNIWGVKTLIKHLVFKSKHQVSIKT